MTASDFFEEPSRRLPVRAECDVLVVGGGPAGIAASIAAARNGASTILLERYGSLGGLATGGLIILLLTMDDGHGEPVIGGLCQEMIDRLEARGAALYPPEAHWGSQAADLVEKYQEWGLVWGRNPGVVRYAVAYDPEEFRAIANDMVEGAGVTPLFHCLGVRALTADGAIAAVAVESKSGREVIRPKMVVDTTGDGDIFASAGAPFELEQVHPWLWFRMGGVDDLEAAFASGEHRFFRALGKGRILAPWGAAGRIDRQISGVDVEDLTHAEIECRRMVMAEADRMKREIPGFSDAYVADIATQIGITESRRLLGAKVLGREEANTRQADVIARTGNWTKAGMVYEIPFGSLYSDRIDNLLAAGRCISVDHRVHHSTKEIPACFATGEAAGTAAAMAVVQHKSPGRLNVPELQRTLVSNGANLGAAGDSLAT